MITKNQKITLIENTLQEIRDKYNLVETLDECLFYANLLFIDRLCEPQYHHLKNARGQKFKGEIGDLVGYHDSLGIRDCIIISGIPQRLKDLEIGFEQGYAGEYNTLILEYVKLKHMQQLAEAYLKAEQKNEAPEIVFCERATGFLEHLPHVYSDLAS